MWARSEERGEVLTMKEAIVKSAGGYRLIANDCFRLAKQTGLLPNQLQAIIWFTRKRLLRIKYDSQVDLFAWSNNDVWRTLLPLAELQPYRSKI
jgi:hypothetical protein